MSSWSECINRFLRAVKQWDDSFGEASTFITVYFCKVYLLFLLWKKTARSAKLSHVKWFSPHSELKMTYGVLSVNGAVAAVITGLFLTEKLLKHVWSPLRRQKHPTWRQTSQDQPGSFKKQIVFDWPREGQRSEKLRFNASLQLFLWGNCCCCC